MNEEEQRLLLLCAQEMIKRWGVAKVLNRKEMEEMLNGMKEIMTTHQTMVLKSSNEESNSVKVRLPSVSDGCGWDDDEQAVDAAVPSSRRSQAATTATTAATAATAASTAAVAVTIASTTATVLA